VGWSVPHNASVQMAGSGSLLFLAILLVPTSFIGFSHTYLFPQIGLSKRKCALDRNAVPSFP
jgi:hypothetical protein